MVSKYSDWTIEQLKEELSKSCCKIPDERLN